MKNMSIEKLFVIIGFIFGLLFIFIIPPFESPDENNHFKRAYAISNLEFFQVKNKDTDKVGLTIPVEMDKYINEKVEWRDDRTKKYSYKDFYKDIYGKQNLSKTRVVEATTTSYTPIIYLTPTLGILASKVISPAPTTAYMLEFARLSSLIFYLIIGYFAIKLTPVYKKSMFTILLLPVSMFLGSMVSYDNILIPIILLGVSLIFKLIYDKDFKFDKKMLIVFSIIAYILLNIKIIYFPVLALLLFIPKDKFKNNSKIKTYMILAGIVIFATILLKIPNYLTPGEGSEWASKQLNYVLTHPFNYLKTLLYNFKCQAKIQIEWMVGTFGLVDTKLPPICILIAFINMLIVFISDAITEKIKMKKSTKLIMIGYVLFAVVAMYTAMYVYWTADLIKTVGGSDIIGIQGRYFIPLLISIPIIFSTTKFNEKSKIYNLANNYFNKNVIVLVTMLFISMFVCLTRFWI